MFVLVINGVQLPQVYMTLREAMEALDAERDRLNWQGVPFDIKQI